MSQQALYRKYRSQTFDQVIGQPHVVDTLVSAVTSGRVSHAYLFTGPRGVGKTSVARLLAKAINCQAEGQAKPCNDCQQCQLTIGGHMDLIEIDAASNRSIDEVRDLRDKISLAPSMGKYKIYIIDEVHMLTKEAFNALLKTLEEPPSHAVFILATTEAHKLPETIISRTQRFSFKPLSEVDLAQGIKLAAKAEKIKIEDEAVTVLAAVADGSLRDALSLLDQAANLDAGQVTAGGIIQLLGWSSQKQIDALIAHMSQGQPKEALGILDQLAQEGSQPGQVVKQLGQRLRQLLLQAAAGKGELTVQQISAMIESIIPCAKSSWPQLALEATVAKIAAGQPTAAVSTPTEPAEKPEAEKSTPVPAAVKSKPVNQNYNLDPNQWLKALHLIKQRNNSLYALIRSCDVQFGPEKITIASRFSFHYDRLKEHKNQSLIEQAVVKTFGSRPSVSIELANQKPAKQPDPSAELISSAIDILGGEVVDE